MKSKRKRDSASPEYHLIYALMMEGRRKGWRLGSGLALAYTPANADGVRRLCASRVGRYPTDDEVSRVHQALTRALAKREQHVHPDHPLNPQYDMKDGHGCVTWSWRIVTVKL